MIRPRLNTLQKIALATAIQRPIVWSRAMLGMAPTVRCRRRGIVWELDLNEGIDFSVFLQGRFEPSTTDALDRLVRPGDHVVDVGANIGAHALPLAVRVGTAGKVIAIEPTHFAFSKLQRNAALNPALAARISLHQAMLAGRSDAPLEAAIYSSWPLGGIQDNLHPVHGARSMATTGATVTTLDHLVQRTSPCRIDLIKIDVDGHECAVIEGGQETLAAFSPILVLELAPYALVENGASLDHLLGLLLPHGYRLFDERTGLSLPQQAAALEAMIPCGGSRNVIAIHATRSDIETFRGR